MPNMKVINIMVIEILQKRSNFNISLLGDSFFYIIHTHRLLLSCSILSHVIIIFIVGRKSNDENYAYLPMKIVDVVNDTYPIFAQWNYRIKSHPIKKEIKLINLRPVDDITTRMAFTNSMEEHVMVSQALLHLCLPGCM